MELTKEMRDFHQTMVTALKWQADEVGSVSIKQLRKFLDQLDDKQNKYYRDYRELKKTTNDTIPDDIKELKLFKKHDQILFADEIKNIIKIEMDYNLDDESIKERKDKIIIYFENYYNE